MRAKRLLEELKNVDPEVLVIVNYPEHRCQGTHGRMPGLAVVDEVDVLFDAPHNVNGGYITSETPKDDVVEQTEVRLRIVKDELPYA